MSVIFQGKCNLWPRGKHCVQRIGHFYAVENAAVFRAVVSIRFAKYPVADETCHLPKCF